MAGLDGVMEQSFFQGSTHKFVYKLANGSSISVIPTAASHEAFNRISPGQRVRLGYRRNEPHIIVQPTDGN
jgi:hypothetical protein